MNSFKPGLVSKSNDVALWCARMISKLGLDFTPHQKIRKVAWKWFSDQTGGLRTCVLALKRHNDVKVKDNIVTIMEQFGKDNYKEMLCDTLLKVCDDPKQYLLIISDLMSCFHESNFSS
jgi:hypothetical protein